MEQDDFGDVNVFLEHYGVKGMKWGQIREQQKTISRAEHLKNGTVYKEGSAIETAKFLKTYINRPAIEAGDVQRRAVQAQAFLDGNAHSFKFKGSLAHAKTEAQIMSDVVKQINPDFGAPGTKMNCRRCTFAYEMRRRGMDVKATTTTNASGQHAVGLKNAITPGQDNATRGRAFIKEANRMFKAGENMWGDATFKEPNFDEKKFRQQLKDEAKKNGTKTSFFKQNEQIWDARNVKRADNIQKTLLKQGDGARGELGMNWMLGGGHSVAYEVVKGNAVVFDTQSGKKYSNPKELKELIGMASSVHYTRLDNKPLNNDYLTRWVQDA